VVHTFWPLMTHSSPSSSARVLSEARSLPASGSEKPWHQAMVPFRMPGMNCCFCSSVAHCRMVGPTRVSPKKSARSGASARANSSLSTTDSIRESPLPPYSLGHEAQIHPPGEQLLVHSWLKAFFSSLAMENPGVPQPSGRLSTSHWRISARNGVDCPRPRGDKVEALLDAPLVWVLAHAGAGGQPVAGGAHRLA
jgi:hypothetical protein